MPKTLEEMRIEDIVRLVFRANDRSLNCQVTTPNEHIIRVTNQILSERIEAKILITLLGEW